MNQKNNLKRHAGLLMVVFFLLIGLICVSAPVQAQNPARLMLGTCPTGSSHYTYCVAATRAINSFSADKVMVTTVVTGGGVDNLEKLGRGQIDFGIGTFAAFYQAYKGIGKYKNDARSNLRAMYLYSVNANNFVVRADSGINKLKDLDGRKFAAGIRGSSGEQLVEQILSTLNIHPDYYRGGLEDQLGAIKDNNIVGYAKSGAFQKLDASTQQLRAFTKLKILNFSDADQAILKKTMPFLNFIEVKEGINPLAPYSTPVQEIGMVTLKDSLTDDQVYAILKGIHENRSTQEAAYSHVKGFDFGKETLRFTIFPLHAGAVRFFRDEGYDVPEDLIPPEMK